MRPLLILAVLLACPPWAFAQTNPAAAPLEGLTLGEPMGAVRDALGDPLNVQFDRLPIDLALHRTRRGVLP